MTEKRFIYHETGYDPFENLAVEQALCETAGPGTCTLYLWQNQSTVVIGRNQNAWKECKIELLTAEGGRLARRLSGGGAVYHDLGNLNFTFVMPSAEYDQGKQFAVIQRACAMCGIETALSGRNDLLADGRKFSGNAFYHHNGHSYHHGTLLVSVDAERMSRYLRPSTEKLKAKGVDSVRSRIVNLAELSPDLTVEALSTALETAFAEIYGKAERLFLSDSHRRLIDQYAARNRSWEWNYGQRLPFDVAFCDRFPWGEISINVKLYDGTVQDVRVETDAMEHTLAERIERTLKGLPFTQTAIVNRLTDTAIPHSADIASLFAELS